MIVDFRPWRLAKLTMDELGPAAEMAAGLAAFSRERAGDFAEADQWIEVVQVIRKLQRGKWSACE